MTAPSCSSVLCPWITSLLLSTWPFFCFPTDFGSRRRPISLRRTAFSYSLTWSFTSEMVSLIRAKPCTRDLCSSVSAVKSKIDTSQPLENISHPQDQAASIQTLCYQRRQQVGLTWVLVWVVQWQIMNSTPSTGKTMQRGRWRSDFTFSVLDESLHQDRIFCDTLSHQQKTLRDSQPSHYWQLTYFLL